MNPQELITTLKDQHRTLQNDLSLALNNSNATGSLVGSTIVENLSKFKKDLLEHLKLENGEFYPDYLEKKTKRGEDITSTKEFVRQMDEIGKVVIGFLEKYSTPESVEKVIPEFRKELANIIGTLNTRIETEEDGVFGLYLLI